MQNDSSSYLNIKGWGVDADPENEPTYPMKKYTGDDHSRLNYQRPELQQATVEILHSNERTGLSAVFGTTLPPKGLSGALRRAAFHFSEGKIRHWLLLILADRVNMIEGFFGDIFRGHLPNVVAELGGKAEWKYNRKGYIVKAVVVTAVLATAVFIFIKRRQNR